MVHMLLMMLAILFPSGVAARESDGGWSDWKPIQSCTVTCGGGVQLMERSCDHPPPSRKGRKCVGRSQQVKECNTHQCAGWSEWQPWYKCTVTCGGGVQLRERACNNWSPGANGLYCQGKRTETRACKTHDCPPPGRWSDWTFWSTCTVSCGRGVFMRKRTCTNPTPGANGLYCIGDHKEVTECTLRPCNPLKECVVTVVNSEDVIWAGIESTVLRLSVTVYMQRGQITVKVPRLLIRVPRAEGSFKFFVNNYGPVEYFTISNSGNDDAWHGNIVLQCDDGILTSCPHAVKLIKSNSPRTCTLQDNVEKTLKMQYG